MISSLGLVGIDVEWRGSTPKPRLPWNEAHAGDSSPSYTNVVFGKSCVGVYPGPNRVDPRGRKICRARRGNIRSCSSSFASFSSYSHLCAAPWTPTSDRCSCPWRLNGITARSLGGGGVN
ncbi:hypothetical protein C2845_PM15G02910 [Panicum miliaceum]|uniref:Uncharacterized protein n=1 Tax=Panicum miliaceum TaxID=4540 RepID=A0A3L6Q7P6_PANMI|nr:hypothetical protein C2845_PM15G02910 [Panicum miliaceum]